MPQLDRAVVTAVIFFVVISAGIMALSAFADPQTSDGESRTGEATLLNGPEEYAAVADSYGTDPTVYNSLGKAVELSGANDSYVRASQSVEIASDSTWGISAWASVTNTSTTETVAVLTLDEWGVLTYNGSADAWEAWVYDPATTESYRLNASAPSPGALTNLQVTANDTHVALYRNNTLGEAKSRSDDAAAAAPSTVSNCPCVLDEVRGIDEYPNSSQRQQLVDEPVAPLNSANRTVRIMFDQAGQSSQLLFYADGRVEQSNVGFVDGHPGEVLEGQSVINDITGSTDYIWDTTGPSLYVVDGGQLDDAPVAYVDYTYHSYGGAVSDWTRSLERTFDMAMMIPTILLLVVIISYLMLLRGR